jgi:hypothetical protein
VPLRSHRRGRQSPGLMPMLSSRLFAVCQRVILEDVSFASVFRYAQEGLRSLRKSAGLHSFALDLAARTNILLARNRSSERIAMALMSSTATASVSAMIGNTRSTKSHYRIALRARKTAWRKKKARDDVCLPGCYQSCSLYRNSCEG